MGRVESSLLDLSKVVFGVLVESELTESTKRVVLVGPDLGEIKDREVSLLSLLGGHGLHIAGPRGVLTALDGLKEILTTMVRVLSADSGGLSISVVLNALVSDHVDLHIDKVAVLVDPLEGVARVAVHVAERSRGSTVGKQLHDLVKTLLVVDQVVPEHVGVLAARLWVALLGVNKVGELDWVADEEDGGVVVYPVVDALLSVELCSKASGITNHIGTSLFSTDGGETGEGLCLFANSVEEVSAGEVADVVGDFKLTIGTKASGVDDSLRHSFSVKMSQHINEMVVLDEQRTGLANHLGLHGVHDGAAIGGGVDGELLIRHIVCLVLDDAISWIIFL